MMLRDLEPGDHVVARNAIQVGLISSWKDIEKGSRGVVLEPSSGWLTRQTTVCFDTGFGGRETVRTPVNSLTVVRRRAGLAAFERRSSLRLQLRLACMLALVGPLAYFAAVYVWHYHTTEGLLMAVVSGVLASVGDTLHFAIQHPVRAVVYLAVTIGIGRIAFRH